MRPVPKAFVTALVLAGKRPGVVDPVAREEDVAHKSLAVLNGKALIKHVVDALQDAPSVGKIIVCCDNPKVFQDTLTEHVSYIEASPQGPSASVCQALARCGTPLLVTTSDNALLQTSWVEEFIAKTHARDADLFIAVATKKAIQEKMPKTQRTYVKLADITFSGCNIFLFKNPVSARIVDLWKEVEKLRKHSLKMALKLGVSTVLKAFMGQLTQIMLARRIYHLTSARICLIALRDGRAAVDVDKPSDLKLIRNLVYNPC